MGLFDDLASKVHDAMASGGAAEHGVVLTHMMEALGGGPGGTPGSSMGAMVKALEHNGLGSIVQSWIGTGPNLPITAAQIQQALGNSHVRDLAARLGIDPAQAAAKLAVVLPHLVDQLTPDGQLPKS
ncbi:MAG: YidB family protein [Gemmatimonadota bacterium]